jgi:hypothetical protein
MCSSRHHICRRIPTTTDRLDHRLAERARKPRHRKGTHSTKARAKSCSAQDSHPSYLTGSHRADRRGAQCQPACCVTASHGHAAPIVEARRFNRFAAPLPHMVTPYPLSRCEDRAQRWLCSADLRQSGIGRVKEGEVRRFPPFFSARSAEKGLPLRRFAASISANSAENSSVHPRTERLA